MNDAPLSTNNSHTVQCEGDFGSLVWILPPELYAALPRATRDDLLDSTGERRIAPYMGDVAKKLLRHVDREGAELSLETSLEQVDHTCCFGTFVWTIGQVLWDTVPDDQREMSIELAKSNIHEFLRDEVLVPLQNYAQRSFGQ